MQYGSTSDYSTSYINFTVDAWKKANALAAIEVRLITINEVLSLGYEWKQICPTCGEGWTKTDDVPSWVYNLNYWYWTMIPYNDSSLNVLSIDNNGEIKTLGAYGVQSIDGAVRPVITISKSAI